jgi:hypothetical protein
LTHVAFDVVDIFAEHDRLKKAGVPFHTEPQTVGLFRSTMAATRMETFSSFRSCWTPAIRLRWKTFFPTWGDNHAQRACATFKVQAVPSDARSWASHAGPGRGVDRDVHFPLWPSTLQCAADGSGDMGHGWRLGPRRRQL